MNKSIAMAVFAAAGIASAVTAQTVTPNPEGYTYEFRIIADGMAGAPSGPGTTYPISSTATQIGFWIQARVAQTVNENWGIVRVSPPAAPETSFLTLTDPANAASLNRGSTNGGNTNFGRGSGYRNGGPATAATGNDAGSQPFPQIGNNQNGAIDSNATRIYSFDSYVGSTRNALNPDEPSNPWGVNGSITPGAPVPSDGTFSPWASVYRFVVIPTNLLNQRVITLNAFAQVQGAIDALPTDASMSQYAMHVGPGRSMSASFTFQWGIPTPGAAALMAVGGVFASRRRR